MRNRCGSGMQCSKSHRIQHGFVACKGTEGGGSCISYKGISLLCSGMPQTCVAGCLTHQSASDLCSPA